MDQRSDRPRAATEYRRRQSGIESRPDKIALWAVVLAVVAMIAGATSARADSGAVGAATLAEQSGAATTDVNRLVR
jgi:hypothetical protein